MLESCQSLTRLQLVQDTRKALGYLGPTFDKRATALEKEWSSALRRAQDHWLRRNMMPELMEKFNIGQRAHGPLDVPARKVVCSALRMHKKHWDLVLGAHVRVKDVTEKVAEECQGLLKAQKDKNTEERRAAAQQAIDRERQALADEKVKLAAEKTAFQAELRAFSALRTFGEYTIIGRQLQRGFGRLTKSSAKILPKPKDHHAVNRRTQINKQRLAEYLVSAE